MNNNDIAFSTVAATEAWSQSFVQFGIVRIFCVREYYAVPVWQDYSRTWSMAWDVLVASRENLRLINKFIMEAEYRKSWMVVDKLLFCNIYSTFTLPALDQWHYCIKHVCTMLRGILICVRVINNEFRLWCCSIPAVQPALLLARW